MVLTAKIKNASTTMPTTMPTTMQAAVIVNPKQTQLQQVAIPEPGASEVVVRLEGCGVCASNLEVWHGQPWFEYPLAPGAPGHEGWGKIVATGAEVVGDAFQVNDRVAMLSAKAYAEYDTAQINSIVKLPKTLDGLPFPAEPLGCAVNIFRRSEIKANHTVAIVGSGFLGVLLTRLVAMQGARVIALSRRPFALEVARSFGASETILMNDHYEIINRVRKLTENKLCEVVIEATGKQWPLDLATELTAERGRLVIAGYHQDGARQVNMQLWNWRGLDVINAHERDPQIYLEGMQEAVRLVAGGHLDPTALYTHTFPIDELGQALDMTSTRPNGFLKALITL